MKTVVENQKGMALISVLLILFSLTVIGIVAVNSANIETLITTNNKVSKQAFFLAEAGSQEAKETLRQRIIDLGGTLDAQINLVQGPDGLLETADDIPFISKTFGSGSYDVRLTERSGPNVTLTSTGSGPLNSRAVVKLMVKVDTTPGQSPQTTTTTTLNPAFGIGILTNGDLRINGSSNINGGTHTNGDTRFNGSGTVTGTVSAHGSITTNGTWNTGNETPNAATVSVPLVTDTWLAQLKAAAQAAGTYHNGNYNFNGSGDLGNQIIFADGNLTLNGSIINGTIVATGNVTINGSSQINGNGAIGTAIVAKGNITMNGSSDSNGAFWSNGSFVQNGASRVIGSIVSTGNITRNGSFNFTANGNIQNNNLPTVTTTVTVPGSPGTATFTVLGWKQG
jgi:hypothetical protein